MAQSAQGSPRQRIEKRIQEVRSSKHPDETSASDCCHPATTSSRRSTLLGTAAVVASALVDVAARRPPEAFASIVDEDVATSIFDSARMSVVSVATSRNGENLGTGSGLVWTQDGYIVTNFHVISKIDKSSDVLTVVVQNQDGSTKSMPARVVGTDTMNDLVVLKADGSDLQPPKIGTSADLRVGQSLYACGFPYGLPASLAAGVVSGLNRSIPSPVGTRIYGTIQTDASINGGNSGGPVFDSAGRVVGIATATYSRSGSGRGSGVNFALPIDKVVKVVPQLIVYGNAAGKRV